MTSDDLRSRGFGVGGSPDAGSPAADVAEPEGPEEPIGRDGGTVEVETRSQWQLFWRKFLRHRLAMGSLIFLVLIVLAAFNATRIAPYGYDEINVVMASSPPTFEEYHFFGTDKLGRDYFSRVLYGTQTSFRVAGVVALLATAIGVIVGGLAGYYRGWVDGVLMRLTDLVLILPALPVLLVAGRFFGQGRPLRIAIILAVIIWVSLARIVRGMFMSLREKEYVEAARASGAGDFRIMFRHMLPNTIGPIVVNMTLTLAAAILIEATLAFIGYGVSPPTPALGQLISEGRGSMQTQWWLVVMPMLAIVAICLAINFVGDGLRDALDPTQQEKG